MRHFNKIITVVLFIFCLTLMAYAQTQKIDIDGDGEKETIQIKTEIVGVNSRSMIFVYKNSKNIFPASVEHGYTAGTSFYTICKDPEYPKRKMVIIVYGIGDKKNQKMIYPALIFQYFPEFNAYHNTIKIKTKRYHEIFRFIRPSQERQKIEDRIITDILQQLHNNRFDIKRVPFENYTYKSQEDLLLNTLITAAKNNDGEKIKSALLFFEGPHSQINDFDKDIDKIIELFGMNPTIISIAKYHNGDVKYSIYFYLVDNYLIPNKPYIDFYLYKNQKKFSYSIYQ